MKVIRRTKDNITHDFVKNLLIDRGILTEDKEYDKKFFYPTKDNEIEPSLLNNME